MMTEYFTTPISRLIWDSKYPCREGGAVHDHVVSDAWWRVARALAAQEPREQGSLPGFEAVRYLQGPLVRGLPADIRMDIATAGLRNSHLLAIAPTGTVSLLSNIVSSGLGPVFVACYRVLSGGTEAAAPPCRCDIEHWAD